LISMISNTIIHETLHIHLEELKQENKFRWLDSGEELICIKMANDDEYKLFFEW